MITSKDELFIMIGYSFLDSKYRQEVDPAAFMVYLDLRRFVWRGHRKVHSRVVELTDQDYLVSFVGQEKLAARNGVSIRNLQRALDKLRDLRWIETQTTGRGLIYILGRKVSTKVEGLRHVGELFFADSIIRSAVKAQGEARDDKSVGSEERHDKSVVSDTTDPSGQTRQDCRTEVDSKELHNGETDQDLPPQKPDNDPSQDGIDGTVIQLHTPAHGEGLKSASDADAVARRVDCAQAVGSGVDKNLEAAKRQDLKRRGKMTKRKSGKSRKASEDGGDSEVKINSKDVENWFRDAMSRKFGAGKTKIKWYPKEQKLALNLLDQYGPELLEKTVVYLVRNWDDVSSRLSIESPIPTINILHGYRDSIFGEMLVGKRRPGVDRLRGEYDAESADRSPAHGWGNLSKRPGD